MRYVTLRSHTWWIPGNALASGSWMNKGPVRKTTPTMRTIGYRLAYSNGTKRPRGTSDAELKKLVTPENYERYKKISRVQVLNSIKVS